MMHIRFIDLLCCPETGEPLRLDGCDEERDGSIMRGTLVSVSGRRYPIVRGIPRFVSAEKYAASFGYEWNRWPRVQFESENVGRPMQGHTTKMWETITANIENDVWGKTIVEFGCGPGRFLDVIRRKGGVAVGLELSAAVEAAGRNFVDEPNVLIVQGDIFHPPFRKGVFDGGYSIGVLHHTPDPALGTQKLSECVRPGGWAAVCVYPRGEFYDYPSVRRFRNWHARLSRIFGYRAALAYAFLSAYGITPLVMRLHRYPRLSPALNRLERNWLVVLGIPDGRWRVLDIFDAITPEIATTHTEDEVASWMTQAGCVSVHRTSWCNTSLVGMRRQ